MRRKLYVSMTIDTNARCTFWQSVMALHMKGGTVEGLGVKQLEELRYGSIHCARAGVRGRQHCFQECNHCLTAIIRCCAVPCTWHAMYKGRRCACI